MFSSAKDESHEVIPHCCACTVLNYIVKLMGNWDNLIYKEGKSTAWYEFIMRRTYRQTSAPIVPSCRLFDDDQKLFKKNDKHFASQILFVSWSIWWCSQSGFSKKSNYIPWWHMLTIWLAILCWYDSRINHTHWPYPANSPKFTQFLFR